MPCARITPPYILNTGREAQPVTGAAFLPKRCTISHMGTGIPSFNDVRDAGFHTRHALVCGWVYVLSLVLDPSGQGNKVKVPFRAERAMIQHV